MAGGLSLSPAVARAHDVGLSCSDFVVEGNGTVRAQLVFSPAEAAQLGAEGRDSFRRRVRDGVVVRSDGAPCEPCAPDATDDSAASSGVSLVFACKPPARSIEVELSFVDALPPGSHHLLQIRDGQTSVSTVVSGSTRSATLSVDGHDSAPGSGADLTRTLLTAVRMGVAHILSGWDHLLFLLALVLGASTLRALVATVSAFTVAHSVTLALAALGVVAPSARWVEPAIAASIVCVAAENLLRSNPGARWPVAFAFGLVHGFGFAGALQELALQRYRLLPTLLGFNAGVEVGQLVILAIVFPVLGRLRTHGEFEARWTRRASASIGAIGTLLMVARIWRP
ncbi:MAG: HupE/UreJ family protein [Polyangiaceae bacterium]